MPDNHDPQTDTVSEPIVPPLDFPINWANPEDERLHWTRDRMHNPGQETPLGAGMNYLTIAGLNAANEDYGLPFRLRFQLINTYVYDAAEPPAFAPEEMASVGEKAQARLMDVIDRLEETWEQEWLPQIHQHLAFWEDFNLVGASISDLIQHLDETTERYYQIWILHFQIVQPVYFAISSFADIYQDLFGHENPFGAYELLEGFSNKTVEMGLSLWRLSRKALADSTVRAVIETADPAQTAAQLQQSEQGRRFLRDLDDFLHEYGQRGELWELNHRSWREDPAPVFDRLRGYLARPDQDLQHDLDTAAAQRDERLVAVRAQLRDYPQPVVAQFEHLLKAAQVATVLSEDHGFWIDFNANYMVRRVCLQLGHRLAEAGVIEHGDDVFYLELEELRATAGALPSLDRKELVAVRKAEEKRFSQIEPPPALGTPAPDSGPPPDNPLARAGMRFWGGPSAAQQTPELITGAPGSAGTARGVVKVVENLADAAKLEPGDVLVAVTTAPPWTPLFAVAAAVVIDTGGILSHCAVVAREYGIPAVVGTGSASTLLQDGQIVEVDGKAGTVRVIG